MLQMRLDTALEKTMKPARLIPILSFVAVAIACKAERTPAPQPIEHVASSVTTDLPQVPLLFVVDGVRLQRDEVPSLTEAQIARVRVIKGHAALRQYGPDASYGVVLITTKSPATAPRT